MSKPTPYDVIIVGAGAAGLMCAIEAGKRGRNVLVLDHAEKIGEKIRISGGGRCNFTNIHAGPKNYISGNPHFATSALRRFTPTDTIQLFDKHAIRHHEKALGQLFCNESATQVVDMLHKECKDASVLIQHPCRIDGIEKSDGAFHVITTCGAFAAPSLVIATGGKSIPKIGATSFAYDIAHQFGLSVIDTRAGLVPFMMEGFGDLSGVSLDATASANGQSFKEALLFTHRGLSGPVILQISSYWREGDQVVINLLPEMDVTSALKTAREAHPKQALRTWMAEQLPKRLASQIADEEGFDMTLADLSNAKIEVVADRLNRWTITPKGTEGYRTAEVTLGGVDVNQLSSKTMEVKDVEGLYFIGESVDVTGWLGGFNFQWAWASGHAAGQFV